MSLALLGASPIVALAADPSLGSGDSGTRTLVGTAITLAVIAIVIAIGVAMGRGARA
jgi:hypothetical protein